MTSPQTERKYRSSSLHSLNTATHEFSRNIGAEKSVPSSDEESVATEGCVAAVTLPVRGIVRELTAGAKVGTTETPERRTFHLNLPESFPWHATFRRQAQLRDGVLRGQIGPLSDPHTPTLPEQGLQVS